MATTPDQFHLNPWTDAVRSYAFVLRNLGRFAVTAAPWAALSIALFVWQQRRLLDGGWQPSPDSFLFIVWLLSDLLFWIGAAGFACGWHRFVLSAVAPNEAFALSAQRTAHYIARFVILVLGLALPSLILVSSYELVFFVMRAAMLGFDLFYSILFDWAFLIFAPIVARFSLILPATALDERRIGLLASWRLTAGNALPIFLGLLFVMVPVLVANYFLVRKEWIPSVVLLEDALTSSRLISTALIFFMGALSATYLSYVYQQLVASRSDAAT